MNFDYVERLGACEVIDYNSKTVVEDLIRAFKNETIGGAMSIGPGAADACRKYISLSFIPNSDHYLGP